MGSHNSGGPSVNELMATNVSIIDNNTCRKAWRGLPHNVSVLEDTTQAEVSARVILGPPCVQKHCRAEGTHIVGGRDAVPHSRPYMASLQLRGRHGCGGLLVKENFVLTAAHLTGSVIINGKRVKDGALPYMASLQNKLGHHVCGGFLVTDNFVLTAAHCDASNPVHVVLGNHNLENSGQKIEIQKVLKHKSYKEVGKGDDIMLLKLKKNAVYGKHVDIIQLPDKNMEVRPNDVCQVAGWGATRSGGPSVNELMATDVSIIDNNTCRKAWRGLPHNVICAGGYNTGRGFCQVS
ncbi:hypothetical protein WMY93_025195 [Mugilogobius chulae]|uniref:trypsin n=1 Tax=Mugilogobius chulae TaxID=88201 RepID=A0AAW0N6N8_9GOBI